MDSSKPSPVESLRIGIATLGGVGYIPWASGTFGTAASIPVYLLLAWPASVYLWYQFREVALPLRYQVLMAACFAVALALAFVTFWFPMQQGVRALDTLGG